MTRAAIGIGSNLGDCRSVVARAVERLETLGTVRARSRLYRTRPWGRSGQPDFVNAVALLDTSLSARALLDGLHVLEAAAGRTPGERWGPRTLDLDILLFGDERIDEPDLCIPHRHLLERAFVLAPLADVDERYREAFDALPQSERAGVQAVELGDERETETPMSTDAVTERVRALAAAFLCSDLVRLRIEGTGDDFVELRRAAVKPPQTESEEAQAPLAAPVAHVEAIKADLVGIVHFSRSGVREGDILEGDRELAYVEALGIRNPVRSLGPGRIAAVRCRDGQAVEYGQVLFQIARE